MVDRQKIFRGCMLPATAVLALAFLFTQAAWAQSSGQDAASVMARVDRNSLIEGETLTLVLQTNNTRQSLEANLDVLREDFVVLDQRSETQMSIVNGEQTAMVRKMVTLEPRRTGHLTIPALRVGGQLTQPIEIYVDAAPEPAPGEPEPVFIEVDLNPAQGPYYVHSQIGLVVRLFYQQTLTEAAISQPEPENASVRLLDEVPFQADRGGQRYRVLERRYALFPERSGTMRIPALVLSGRLVDRNSSRLWQPSNRGRRVRVESDPITIEVAPRPAEFTGDDWQPARSYRLGEQLSTSGAVHVGEPVTRTITIDAVGLEENMIAEPRWGEIPDARIYPDQPQGISRDDGEWVLGHKEFRYAVVPEKAGELVLPELSVAWWDTVADRERISVLPARTVNVLPSPVSASSAVSDPGNVALAPGPQTSPAPAGAGGYWRWLAITFAALWLATLVYAARGKGRRVQPKIPEKEQEESEVAAELKRACKKGDAPAARTALRKWLRAHAPLPGSQTTGLIAFARRCGDDALAREVRELDAAGFSREGGNRWDGSKLYSAWQQWRESVRKADANGQAPIIDLYAPENRVKRAV